MSIWIILAALIILIGAAAWYLLITTEGVYLGRRVVIFLYDLYASRYDRIKRFEAVWESERLGQPLLQVLEEIDQPLILDVAVGTARLPIALLRENAFRGYIIGLDFSRKMLAQAAHNLTSERGAQRVALIHQTAEALPFPDETFDGVTCLEALEFMPHPLQVVGELVRVLRPGGVLLISNRKGTGARLMPGKTLSTERLLTLLEHHFGLSDVRKAIWQVDYEQVWAFKPGLLDPALDIAPAAAPLAERLVCPRCGKVGFTPSYACRACGGTLPTGTDGVVEYHQG